MPISDAPGTDDPVANLGRLCRYRWDSHLLISLHEAGRPMRRAELTRQVSQLADERISDTQMTRTLHRLLARRLIIDETEHNRKRWRLTLTGRDEAEYLSHLINRLRGRADPDRPPTNHPTPAAATGAYTLTTTRWSTDLLATGPVPLTPPERTRLLNQLTHRLESALATADPHAVRSVGADLLTAGYLNPEALGTTIHMITTPLVQHQTGPAAHVPQLVAQLAIGWAEASRQQALDQQELLRNATISAHEQAGP